ncbi:MAG: hypothetical protein ACYDAJ_10870 [Nitrosotalea sp.]
MQRTAKDKTEGKLNPEVDAYLERVISGKEKTISFDGPEDCQKHIKNILEED